MSAMKDRKTRLIPVVVQVLATVVASGVALYYERKFNEYHANTLWFPPELLREVRENGKTLVYWINESGSERISLIDEEN